MKRYSMELREQVVAACDRKEGKREEIAKRFNVSTAWIRRLLQRRRETGSIAALPQNPGRKPALNDEQMQRLRGIMEQQPDSTLRQLKESLGVTLSDGAMIRALGRMNLTLKNSRSRRIIENVDCVASPLVGGEPVT